MTKNVKIDNEKVALKLLNKYADEYHILEEEIKYLQKENQNLRNNLKLRFQK